MRRDAGLAPHPSVSAPAPSSSRQAAPRTLAPRAAAPHRQGGKQDDAIALDDDDEVEETGAPAAASHAPKRAPPSSAEPFTLRTKRVMFGTWNCGPAMITFTDRTMEWLPEQSYGLPGTGDYPLISVKLATMTHFEVDKQSGGLCFWSMHEPPFHRDLGDRFAPFLSHGAPLPPSLALARALLPFANSR